MVWPSKVQHLIVELGYVVASLREVEDLCDRGEGIKGMGEDGRVR